MTTRDLDKIVIHWSGMTHKSMTSSLFTPFWKHFLKSGRKLFREDLERSCENWKIESPVYSIFLYFRLFFFCVFNIFRICFVKIRQIKWKLWRAVICLASKKATGGRGFHCDRPEITLLHSYLCDLSLEIAYFWRATVLREAGKQNTILSIENNLQIIPLSLLLLSQTVQIGNFTITEFV